MAALKTMRRALALAPLRALARSYRAPASYVHLAPGGDWWTGDEIFAAKHNPQDYVRSLELPTGAVVREDVDHETLLRMYDEKVLDAGALEPAWSGGAPTAALAEPGRCAVGEAFAPLELLSRTWIAEDSFVVRFGLADATKPLGLATCACLLVRAGDAVRPYTPVSTNGMAGAFELLVRAYPDGAVSSALASLDVGDSLDFKHVPPNVKVRYPFAANRVGMLAGGTGVTPMLQALHAILGSRATDATPVALALGSRTADGILARSTVDGWAAADPGFSVEHVLSEEPEGSAWAGTRGHIDADVIRRTCPPPGSGGLVLVCGPPRMYAALCGPRGADEVTGLLGDLGYSRAEVYAF